MVFKKIRDIFKDLLIKFMLLIFVVILFLSITELLFFSKDIENNINPLEDCMIKSRNPKLVYEFIPNTECEINGTKFKINSHGFRDYEYNLEKPNNKFRIAIVGDSYTFGWRLEFNETFTKLLEKRLNDNLPNLNYEVFNFGNPGYNTILEANLLEEKILDYNPNLIIIAYTPGDPECYWDFCSEELKKYTSKSYESRDLPITKEGLQKYLLKIKFLSFTYKKYENLLYNLGIKDYSDSIIVKLHEKDSPTWHSVQDSFKRIAEMTKEKNVPVILVIFPELDLMIKPKLHFGFSIKKSNYDSYNKYPLNNIQKQIKDEGLLNGFEVLDITPYFEGIDPFSLMVIPEVTEEGDGHPNAKGNEIIAAVIYDYIKAR